MQKTYIKTFIAIIAIITMVLINSNFYAKAESENVSDSDITAGLNIDTGVIAQRDNENGQTTNDLQIEILTPESSKINSAIDQQEQTLMNDTKERLFSGQYSKDDDTPAVKDQLFTQQQSSYISERNTSYENQWIEIVLAVVAAGVIVIVTYSCVMAFRRHRQQ